MTKAEFLDQLAGDDRLGSKKAAGDAVDAVLDAITDTLSGGGEVSFTGFGKFHVAERGPAPGRQPAHRRADHDPGRQGAALLRRLGPEDQGQGRLISWRCSRIGWRRSSTSAAARSASASTPTRPKLAGDGRDAARRRAPAAELAAAAVVDALPRPDRARRPGLRRGQAAARLLRAPRRARLGGAGRGLRRRPRGRPAGRSPTASAATCRSPPPPTRRRWSARRRPPGAPVPGLGADAFTANPLLGLDALEPLVGRRGRDRRRRLRPGPDQQPRRRRRPGPARPGAARCTSASRGWSTALSGRLLGERGLSGMGAVVGATEPEHIARLRELMPRSIFLIPGVGAQGGQAGAARRRLRGRRPPPPSSPPRAGSPPIPTRPPPPSACGRPFGTFRPPEGA